KHVIEAFGISTLSQSPLLFFHKQLPHSFKLFPYTPLFRSGRARAAVVGRHRGEVVAPRGDVRPGEAVRRARGRTEERRPLVEVQDRKSTRLNSSHVAISYAVFCLKKKIK